MQTKNLNTYKITHENGRVDFISSENAKQAVASVDDIEHTPVVALLRTAKNVKVLLNDVPAVITLQTTITGGEGSIATPSVGELHSGDSVKLKCIPARNYEFVAWKLDNEVVSTEAEFLLTVPEVEEGVELLSYVAEVKLSDVSWTSAVTPSEAGTAGCLAFPVEGTVKANENISLIAIEKEGYTFDHWERNGESIGTNNILEATVTPLAEGEVSCVYTAVFTAE